MFLIIIMLVVLFGMMTLAPYLIKRLIKTMNSELYVLWVFIVVMWLYVLIKITNE